MKDDKWPTHWRCATTGNLVTLGGIQAVHLQIKYGKAAAARTEQATARKARRAAARAEAGYVDVETLLLPEDE